MYVRLALFLAAFVALFGCTNASVTFETINGTVTLDPSGGGGNGGGGGPGGDDALAVEGPSTVAFGAIIEYSGTGGKSPYEYSLKIGSDGSIDDTGVFTAPREVGSATVVVTDSEGEEAELAVQVVGNGTLGLIGTKEILDIEMPAGEAWEVAEPRKIIATDDLGFIVLSDIRRSGPTKRSVFLTRMNEDGSINENFGVDGVFVKDISGNHAEQEVKDVAITPKGNLIFGGSSILAENAGWMYPLTLWGKLLANFTDPKFFDAGGGAIEVKSLASQGSTNGESYIGVGMAVPNAAPSVLITRYNDDGTADTSFGKISNNSDMANQGWVEDKYGLLGGAQTMSAEATAVTLDKDDNIYVVGYREPTGKEQDCMMIKYTEDGIRPASNGVYTYDLLPDEQDMCVDIHYHEAHLYITGWSSTNSGSESYFIRKADTDGILDGSFAIVTELESDSSANTGILKTLRLSSGRGLIVFEGGYNTGGEAMAKLTMYDENGKIQDDFGSQGELYIRSPNGGDYQFSARSIVEADDGSLLITGHHFQPQDTMKHAAVMKVWP